MCSKGKIEIIDNVRLVSFPKNIVTRRRGPRKGTTYKPSGKYTFESLLLFLEERKTFGIMSYICYRTTNESKQRRS